MHKYSSLSIDSMFNLFKFFLALVMAMSIGLASAATRYSYVTKKVRLKDGIVVSQKWQYTYINNKLRAKAKIQEVVLSWQKPVVTYNTVTKKDTQSDGSVIEKITHLNLFIYKG